MTTQLNPLNLDYELKSALDLTKREILLTLNCHAIGTIESFDSGVGVRAPRATVTINYMKSFFSLNEQGVYTQNNVKYPVLIDCPVLIPQGGDCALTLPIAPGDQCLVLFNDRDIDAWFNSGQVGPTNTLRLHSFADGIVFVGLRHDQDPFEVYDNTRAMLQNGTTYVGVGPDLIKLANELTSLGTILTNLVTALSTLTSAMSGANAGNIPATIATPAAAAVISLTNVQTLITELLE